jgi:hypothetical protein
MSKTKFYEVIHHDEGVMMTMPIDENRALIFLKMTEVIAVKGNIPRVGDKVKVRRYPAGEKIYGTVHEVSPNGIPVRVRLDDGKIIELVGYLVQLVNLIEAIIKAIKELFDKGEDAALVYLPMIQFYHRRAASMAAPKHA